MSKTNKMKVILLVLLLSIIISLLISVCINESNKNDNTKDEANITIYYSTSSNENETFLLIVSSENNEIYNQTLSPEPGELIYNGDANDSIYHISVNWNNKTDEIDFKPTRQNSLSLVIKNNNVELKEVSD